MNSSQFFLGLLLNHLLADSIKSLLLGSTENKNGDTFPDMYFFIDIYFFLLIILDEEVSYFGQRNLHEENALRRPHCCPNNCGRRYKYKAGVYQHLKFECGKEPQFQCTVCYKRFSLRNNWKAHCVVKHGLYVS